MSQQTSQSFGQTGKVVLPDATLTHLKLFSQRRNKGDVEKCGSGVFVSVLPWRCCVTKNPETQSSIKANTDFLLTGLWVTCASTGPAGVSWTCVPLILGPRLKQQHFRGTLSSQGWHKQKPSNTTHISVKPQLRHSLLQSCSHSIGPRVTWPSPKSVAWGNILCLMRGIEVSHMSSGLGV